MNNNIMDMPGTIGGAKLVFPEDTSTLLKITEEVEVNLQVLESAVKENIPPRLTESK